MKPQEWEALFGPGYVINLTNEERRYFALEPIESTWDAQSFCYQSHLRHTRLTIFFSGNTIVKAIEEEINAKPCGYCFGERVSEEVRSKPDGFRYFESYTEYDTRLLTEDRQFILPLTERGKPKKLTATAVRGVAPFGCSFTVKMTRVSIWGEGGSLYLTNPRAEQEFPIGERAAAAGIDSEEDFHAFARRYMDTCPPDYFERLEAFRRARRVTVKYRPGDVFRMAYDRTHWCYGIITGEVNRLRKLPEMPENSTFHTLMMVPILVRLYALISDRADMTPQELEAYPLGRVMICGDNDIIWGTHPIVEHRELTAEDIEFPLIVGRWRLRIPGLSRRTEPEDVPVEWGLCSTVIPWRSMPEGLRQRLADYDSPHGGVQMGIPPDYALPDEKLQAVHAFRENLLNPQNTAFRGEIMRAAGLEADADFDDFARRFGGLTRQEILERMQNSSARK